MRHEPTTARSALPQCKEWGNQRIARELARRTEEKVKLRGSMSA